MAFLARRWLVWLMSFLALLSLGLASPASAHKGHKKQQQAAQAQQAPTAAQTSEERLTLGGESPLVGMNGMMEDMAKDRSQMSLGERVIDWLGRTHPFIIHFPIAFFPAALFTAVIGRRRPNFMKPVQFLVVTGGLFAPLAALFGWFNAGWSLTDTDALVAFHRWLGTAIGVGGLGVGIWALVRPESDRSNGMIAALGLMTLAILVQGWLGGSMIHGIDHLSW